MALYHRKGKICSIVFMLDRFFFKTVDFLSSPILSSVLSAWLVSQLIKSVISFLARHLSKRELIESLFWRTGGMPSSHSATVCALATSIGLKEGINSSIFMVCLTYAFTTIRDSLGVRYSTGEQAKKLNNIGRELKRKVGIEDTPVKEIKGHRPIEVLVGCWIGVSLGFIFS